MSDMKNFDAVFDGLKEIEMHARELDHIIDAMMILGLPVGKHLQHIQTRVLDGAIAARRGFNGYIVEQTRAAEQSTNNMVRAALVGVLDATDRL